MAGQRVSLPGAVITEVLRPRPLTPVPLGPPGLLGIANLRGQMLPVVSLAALLGAVDAAASPATRIVVAACAGGVGLLVDAVLAFGADPDATPIDLAALLTARFVNAARPAHAPATRPAMPPPAAATADETVLLGLRVAGQGYALALAEIVEIAALPTEVMTVPGTDPAMLGVIAWRDGLLPLLSLRVLLGMAPSGYDPAKARIAVISIAGRPVGLVADAVTGILHVPRDAIAPVPAVLTRGNAEAQVQAICRLDGGRRLVAHLSAARLLDAATIARLQAGLPAVALAETSGADARIGRGEAFVVVSIGAAAYGLPIAAVDAVVRHPGALTRVPHAPGFVEGVMNLRGQIVPVIDPHRQFGGDQAAPRQNRRVVLTRIGAVKTGLAVDAACEVVTVRPGDLQPAPPFAVGDVPIFDRIATRRADGSMILLVDPRTLLDAAERDVLAALAQRAAATAAA